MPRTRKTHPPSPKANVAVEAIRIVRTAAEISKVVDVHLNLVANWKRQALAQMPALRLPARIPTPRRMPSTSRSGG